MTLDTLKEIKELIEGSPRISPTRREDLLVLLEELKVEIMMMEVHQRERLKSVVNSTENMARGHLEQSTSHEILAELQEDVALAIHEFEADHPKVVGILQALCTQLSNLGI
ncbi:hypothetical protein DID77_02410 [Candidatus Marinamargulisbacteria bacterium SCGC AG-439-L15]|nr:hypothetical protein DID77_02410 [Candidatus Marinamargulisbacteria bacterium SCGC AG-439-L15]